jgi:exodeoxyribonuclease V beta subunit
MNQSRQFSVFESPLDSHILIEASAGTGKTYTITGLYIRLLLEKEINLDRLLVVTFTRMATKELKERIMNRLRSSLRALETGDSNGDPFLAGLLASVEHQPAAMDRLRSSIRNFDDARIFTIHGFCQQVLREESLSSGAPFEIEITRSDEFLTEAAEDYWRIFVNAYSDNEAGRYLIDKLMGLGAGPEEFLKVLIPSIQYKNDNETEFKGTGDFDPLPFIESVLSLRHELSGIWRAEREEIIRQLIGSDVKGMTEKNVDSRAAKMDSFLLQEGYSQDSFSQMRYFLPSYFRDNLKKNKTGLPEHPFFERCEEYEVMAAEIPRVSTWILENAIHSICESRDKKSSESSVLTYDDLLARLNDALESPVSGPGLAARLRQKYPCALVDEFQDTDPVQYDIFNKVYPADSRETSLMMIGDPKQAIYAFRGADLYAYIRAREQVPAGSRYTLQKNFRSTPELIDAINRLFSPEHETPFLEDKISYHRIEAGNPDLSGSYEMYGKKAVPVKIFSCQGIHSKSTLTPLYLRETARQVTELVREGFRGDATIREQHKKRNLKAADIAVLVHSHRDAETIKEYLKELGVGSVTYSREKVFESREAERVEQLLTAVLDPVSRPAVQSAVVSGFFGLKLSAIAGQLLNESRLLQLTERLQGLNECWYHQGVYPMLRKVLFEGDGMNHIASLHNSERVITNLQQLNELAANAELEHGFDPPALLRWFRKKMTESSSDDEEALRLESDENLVKITTIHNSKGLEFPVVFCPTLWSGREYSNRNNHIETYHKSQSPFGRVVNLQQYDSDEREHAVRRAHFEEISEEVRKAYVAMTRARYECRLFWGTTDTAQLSGIGALLSGRESVTRSIREKLKVGKEGGPDESEFERVLEQLAAENPELISFHDLDTIAEKAEPLQVTDTGSEIPAKQYQGEPELKPDKRLFSFTSLTHQQHSGITEPDYDQYLEGFIDYATSGMAEEPAKLDIFHFPKGKTAGTFIHKLFEHEAFDFRMPEYNTAVISDLIGDYGYDPKWIPALNEMMQAVTKADYGDLALNQVAPNEMLREMEFYMPVSEPELKEIQSVIRNGKAGKETNNLSRNYLTGYIDLVVRQNGKYYILDYKSNYLGDSIEEYHPDVLNDEMLQAGYDIQYHLYISALVKYLEKRDPAFSYSAGFGGVYYLFVRGMEQGSAAGIFFDKPAEETIQKLQNLLERDGTTG